MTTIIWFRQDLRLADNTALAAAASRGAVIPVYVLEDSGEGEWPLGGAQRWWLHQSLVSLDASLRKLGSRLILCRGSAMNALDELVTQTGADTVYWNRCYEPAAVARDSQIKESLRTRGIEVQSFNASLLQEPWEIRNQSGRPFQVFTPFWRHCLKLEDPRPPQPAPTKLVAPKSWPAGEELGDLTLLPTVRWYEGMAAFWKPGEDGAAANLKQFVAQSVWNYSDTRNLPALRGTSQLSPHLHFGELSPHQIWEAVKVRALREALPAELWRSNQFLTEVYWREFAYHLLFHYRHTPTEPLRAEFARFPWAQNAAHLQAWQRGRTGIPLVDAGMRQLWHTGWMHNRVRMIVGSFLVKNLLLPWTDGARWFWDTLVDADLASNTLGWQWCAGCGADAAPYFRVFNPVTQGEKFDPDGDYVRAWVPELSRMPTKHIHAPWEAPESVLREAEVELGGNYPRPIVNLKATRERALEAYQRMRAR